DECDAQVGDWVRQLIDQQVLWLEKRGEFTVLRLNDGSWEVMRGHRKVSLTRMARLDKVERSKSESVSWEGVDEQLFGALRALRRRTADEQQIPAYIVFTDRTLREMARTKPATPERLRLIHGVGEQKLKALGDRFIECIREYTKASVEA